MIDFKLKKAAILILASTFVFATGLDHVQFSLKPTMQKQGADIIFANGFEDSTPPVATYTSDPVADISEIPTVETGSELVGSVAGSFQTDQMGQANYSIPILTGAGTAGLAPQISLNYSSGSGNGPIGVGWSLSGTTIITRCRETEESRDGAVAITPQPINWDNTDKLCLNGERLYLATGTNYWDDASTYRTERDQFARITYISSTDSFTIERKDGSTAYYGDTFDSAIAAVDVTASPTYAWAISRFKDNMNNYIDYTYQQFGDLEFVLVDIDYTGHIGNGTTLDPSHPTYNNISFNYENTRSDKTTAYIAGAKIAMSQRLASIDSFIDGTNVRSYTLAYNNSSHSGRSIMSSISECRGTSCLPITTFAWSQPNAQFKTTATGGISFPKNLDSSKLGDIDGDGRADLVFVDNTTNTFKVALANGSVGFIITTNTSIAAPTGTAIDNKWQLMDFNADGRQDLLKQVGSSWVVYLANSGSVGFSTTATPTGITESVESDFQIVDVNGDGLADLLYENAEVLYVRYLEVSGNSYGFSNTAIEIDLPNVPSLISGITPPSGGAIMRYQFHKSGQINIIASDVNGDGVADLLLKSDVYTIQTATANTGQEHYKFISAGKGAVVPQGGGGPIEVLDSSHWVAFIANGMINDINGNPTNKLDFFSENYYIKEYTAHKYIKFIDINADGLTDVLARETSNNWQYTLSNGMGFNAFATVGVISNEDQIQLFDYNLDGYIDVVYPLSTTGQPYYAKEWTGSGFGSQSYIGAKAEDYNQNINLFMDLNGDGREDQLRIDTSGAQGVQSIYIREDTYDAIDKIIEITTGVNRTDTKTTIGYKPITFSSAYIQGTGANLLNFGNNSPVFDYLSSMYVVKSVTTDTPTENDATTRTTMTYQYKDARVQTGGRGFLGFGEIITSVPVKGSSETQNFLLQTQTTYHQEFPYIGLPKTVTVNQYEVAPTPPLVCSGNDSCFPPPCFPGQSCGIAQKAAITHTLLSETSNTFAKTTTVGKSQFAYINSTIEKTYAPNGTGLLKTRVQTTSHDSFGNPEVNTVNIYDGLYDELNPNTNLLHTTTTTNTYDNLTTNWKIGLLRSTSTTVTRPSQPSVTTLMQYDYNTSTGLLSEERKFPNDTADKFLRILHEYDTYGNELKTISCSGVDFTVSQCTNTTTLAKDVPDSTNETLVHRYNQLVFDTKGRYVNQVKNSLNQTVSSIINRDIYGNPISTTDLLGTTTSNTYDIFGTAQTSYSSLGTWSYASKKWCSDLVGTSADTSCPANATIRISNRASGGSLSYGFMDKLGRTISTTTRSFNATDDSNTPNSDERWIINDQYFDNLGRGVTTVGPYFYGETNTANIPVTTTQYDRYNRVTKVTLPDGATETISYVGFVTTTTNALNQTKTETKNALGELFQSEDNLNNTLNYTYNSQGLVTEIKRTINLGLVNEEIELLTKNTYDKAGRKTTSLDVDTGTTTSEYNAEGEIIRVTDAKGQYSTSYRDELGRVYLTENFDNTNTKKLSTVQTYDPNTNQIIQEKEFLGADGFKRDYIYDNLNRLSTISITINDTENAGCGIFGLCSFENMVFYDQYSRAKIEQDASGKAIQNNYNAQGYLERITNAADTNKHYYKINKTDNRGNVVQDTKADSLVSNYSFDKDRGFMTDINTTGLASNLNYNYSYDELGNLKKRADINQNLSECFYYDGLNRMTGSARHSSFGVNCGAPPTPIESKSISYNGKGNITNKDNQLYTYLTAAADSMTINTSSPISPHQVQSKGSQVFTYDANGNNTAMTNFKSKNGTFQTRHLEYSVFNKIQRMWTGNDTNNPIAEAIYKYGTNRQKYARIDTEGTTSKVTYFIGNVEIEYNGTTVKYKRQLGNYAIITEQGTTTTEAYLFTDHLGSVDTITDQNGNDLQKMSFSAWGQGRLSSNWNTITVPTLRQQMDTYTNRGFTGHEMVDAFGIINMGGRIYDAALGRVLQADPFVQDPTNTQSFNRYTYVFNNPLSYTDPSGYFSLRSALGFAVGLVFSIFNPFALGVFWSAFVAGFASSYIITGNLKTALISGIIAGSIAFVGDKIFPKKIADKVDAKNANKKPDLGGSLDTTTGNPQFKEIPAPNIPDATGKALDKVIEKTSQRAPSSVSDAINTVDDKVALGRIVVKARFAADGGFINQIPKFTVARSEIIIGFMSQGITSLLIAKWRQEFVSHSIDNQFSDLGFGQGMSDNGIANELLGIQQDLIKYEAVNKWYATTSFAVSMAAIAPLSMSEGAIAAGLGVRNGARSIGNVARRQLLKLNANRALKESLVDGIGEALGTPSLQSAYATVARSESIKILVKTKAADSIKRAVDLIPR